MLNSHHKNWECNLVLLPGITISFGILPCYSLACFISINKEGMKVGCYFQSFAHMLPILCLLSYSKARERRRTFYISPPSMCYSKNKISCLPASFCNVAHTSSLSLHTNLNWSLVEDLQRAENNRFHTLGSFTSSFCVAFCIWWHGVIHGVILPYSDKMAIWEVGECSIPATLQMHTTTTWSLLWFSDKTPLYRQIIKAEFEQSMESVTWSN